MCCATYCSVDVNKYLIMSKLEHLNSKVAKLLTVAVHEVLEIVKETVTQYQEKTARTQRENERLRIKLQEALEKLAKEREVSRHATVSKSFNCVPHQQQMNKLSHIKSNFTHTQTQSDCSHMTDPETVCDLSVALTLAGCQKTSPVSKDSPPAKVKGTDLLSTVKWTQHISHESNASCADSKPDITVEHIKTEFDCTQNISTQMQLSQSSHDFAEDLSVAMVRQEPVTSGPIFTDESSDYGLAFINSGHNTTERHLGYGRGVHSIPQGEEHHVCLVCGKTFNRVGNLRIHQRCHTGEKPYRCLICGRCFSQAGDLKKHKRVHTGEKPYCCARCGKSFSRGENLKRHQKIHIGETSHLQQSERNPQIN
ncbi:zinc finger protein 846-like isoform X2 [Xyrauchen texanus]|uniref:zinc finger protein 846-like isoform X2 n=1 Tax=Xyrauchen texanus TaxID=154827 RepID=UPI002241C0A8|nr:zinc finger protein 846-like isoform X2 [Xyrauchen texanus]